MICIVFQSDPRSADSNELSFLARETSIPTDEKVHHRLDAWKKPLKQQHSHSPVSSSSYNYLHNWHVQGSRRDAGRANEFSNHYIPGYSQPAASQRRDNADETERGFKEPEERMAKQLNGHHKNPHAKEKGLRDPYNRVLPRTDVDVRTEQKADGLLQQKSKIDSSKSLAAQLENHLASRKAGKIHRNDGSSHKHSNSAKQVGNSERSLTSLENSNKLKQINGFSYGVPEGQVSRFSTENLLREGSR